jgi:hypothetical protein
MLVPELGIVSVLHFAAQASTLAVIVEVRSIYTLSVDDATVSTVF